MLPLESTMKTSYCVQCKRYVFVPYQCLESNINGVEWERLERIEKMRLERIRIRRQREKMCDGAINWIICTCAILLFAIILFRYFPSFVING